MSNEDLPPHLRREERRPAELPLMEELPPAPIEPPAEQEVPPPDPFLRRPAELG